MADSGVPSPREGSHACSSVSCCADGRVQGWPSARFVSGNQAKSGVGTGVRKRKGVVGKTAGFRPVRTGQRLPCVSRAVRMHHDPSGALALPMCRRHQPRKQTGVWPRKSKSRAILGVGMALARAPTLCRRRRDRRPLTRWRHLPRQPPQYGQKRRKIWPPSICRHHGSGPFTGAASAQKRGVCGRSSTGS